MGYIAEKNINRSKGKEEGSSLHVPVQPGGSLLCWVHQALLLLFGDPAEVAMVPFHCWGQQCGGCWGLILMWNRDAAGMGIGPGFSLS